jgi:hypothetical protein
VVLDLTRYHEIDWDSDDDPNGNLAHCLHPDHLGSEPERVVAEVLSEEPVEVKMRVRTAEFAIVGPDSTRSRWWVILFDTSHKRGDWLRPVTGWQANAAERQAWEQGRRGGTISPWLTGI